MAKRILPTRGSTSRFAACVRRWSRRLQFDRLFQARLLVATALLAHAVVLLWMARGWFFTGDDWDYLARSGWGDVLAPHGGHITAGVAASAIVAKQVAGLDYWPVYPLVVAVVWPAVAYAAWWVWRRSGVAPIPAAGGAVMIGWLVSGAYIQFGHTAMPAALASLLPAVWLDERPLTVRNGAAGFGLSLFAVLVGSTGVVVTGVRAVTALGYRKWTGVAGAVPALAVYAVVRSLVGSDRSVSVAFGLGDLGTIAGIVRDLIGPGIRWNLLLPTALEDAGAVLLLAACVWVLIRRRFDYRAVTLVLAAAAYLGTVAVVRILPRPDVVERFAEGVYRHEFAALRYVNPLVIAVVVLGLPLVAVWMGRGDARLRRAAVAVMAAVVLVGGVVRTIDVFDRISDKSIPKAREAAGYALLVDAGEPVVDPGRRAGSANSVNFTFEVLAGFSEVGLVDGLVSSEVYEVRGIEVTDEDELGARGAMRFATSRVAPPGSSASGAEDCVVAGPSGVEATITEAAEVRLESDGQPEPSATARWVGDAGVGLLEIGPGPFGRSGRMTLRIAAPAPDAAPATVVIGGRGIRVCFLP